ncbi:unnamed protein product [Sphenostylis stenocarpa]|uniref:U2A'/phosphoprotein 32 family A C-terminal domain-containing protein n=1 Tax=Sphenostylis stenocarpa TaxID=92480 RepID=A0AA87B7H9_9FABA|nr:unnamed protein product [Sphenostylis stenocarpa]
MVRLTADLIWKSPHFFNAVKDRELDLRGNKIAVIENLGATEDQFDTIDLSDNEIVKLENVPYLNRLGTMIINNNRITRIHPNIGEFLPKLHTLVLTNNRIVNLVEIDPLASLPKLQFLSLLDNNITKKTNYRLYVINKLKSLRVLDFKKVKNKERLEAKNLFASKEVIEEIQRTPAKPLSPPNVSEATEEQQTPKVIAPTPEQITAIKAAIVNSQTLEEVARLEKALKSGQLPADLKGLNDNIVLDNVHEKPEDMIHDDRGQADAKSNDTQEQRNADSTSMEQVYVHFYIFCRLFLVSNSLYPVPTVSDPIESLFLAVWFSWVCCLVDVLTLHEIQEVWKYGKSLIVPHLNDTHAEAWIQNRASPQGLSSCSIPSSGEGTMSKGFVTDMLQEKDFPMEYLLYKRK